jgi:uncharacterized protein YbjQ (UPF0145 family)
MQFKRLTIAALLLGALPAVSQARDTPHFLPFQPVVAEATQAGRLDGSVKFYLAGTGPKATIVRPGITTAQKTNGVGKSDEEACNWALQSALIRLQNAAKAAGANAVVNIVSNYKNIPHSDSQKYECHAGAVMTGVAFRGDLAKIK